MTGSNGYRMWPLGRRIWRGLAALFLTLACASGAWSQCAAPDLRTNVAPDHGDGPMPIMIAFSVLDVMGIDDVNQQIEVDLLLRMHWTDARLAEYEGCQFQVSQVWVPHLRLLNSSNLRLAFRNSRDRVTIGENGEVSYFQRGTGAISSYHSLRDFPFDKHALAIRFAIQMNHTAFELVADPDDTWIANRLNIEGWNVSGVRVDTGPFVLRNGAEPVEAVNLTVLAARNPEFYVYRMLVLLALVVGMSWIIFWVPPSRFEFQIGIGATSMLTAIAFNLAIAGRLPPVGYLTTLDKLVIWAILLVFLSIIEALVAGRMVMNDRETEAIRMDRACRVLFPVLLLGGWLGIVLYG
ncbi:MAG: hypothetical protein AAGA05_07115 [Pseudomonadota bacterium]